MGSSLVKSKLFSDLSAYNGFLLGRGAQITQLQEPNPNSHLEMPSKSQRSSTVENRIIENAYLLLPAILGTGIAYLISLNISLKSASRQKASDDSPKSTEQGTVQDFLSEYTNHAVKLITLTYVFVSVIGIAVFIYRSGVGVEIKSPIIRLLPIGIGLASATFLFASVNLAMFVLFPTSFEDQIGERWVDRAISFIYYSSLGLTTGAVGDILPTENTTRILLAMEGMVNLVIFSLLIASLFGQN